MAEQCIETHPEQPEVCCDKDAHPFGSHFNRATGLVWDGLPMPTRTRKGSRVMEVVKAMDEAGSGVRTGPPSLASGPPGAAVRSWRSEQDEWLALAKDALKEVCQSQPTFTNEAVWARVPNIREKRAMVLVIRHGLHAGWMHEDSAVRVKGTWATADGVTFPLNKLVPVYRSDLFHD